MAWLGENLSQLEPQDICGSNWVPYFNERNLDIPEWVRFHISKISSETSQLQLELKARVLDNFIRSSINISSWSDLFDGYIYNEIFALVHTGVIESHGTLEDMDFPDYVLRDIFHDALALFQIEHPSEYADFYNQSSHDVIFGHLTIDIDLLLPEIIAWEENEISNIRPVSRPDNMYQLVRRTDSYKEALLERNSDYFDMVQEELKINQFNVLKQEWFSEELIRFISEDLFPRVCWEGFQCWPDAIDRIKTLCLFIIDIETEWGQNLRNGMINWKQTLPESERSSASWYMHQLNQHWRIDTDGDGDIDYNTIDTNLRYAADLYNTWVIEIPDSEHNYKLREVHRINTDVAPQAQWVLDLWEYNKEWRDAIDFSIDDQLKMFLIRTMFEDWDALRWILLWEELLTSARAVYRAHHTWVHEDEDTKTRLDKFLPLYY